MNLCHISTDIILIYEAIKEESYVGHKMADKLNGIPETAYCGLQVENSLYWKVHVKTVVETFKCN